MKRHSFSTLILPKITAVHRVRYRLRQRVSFHRLPIRILITFLQTYSAKPAQMTETHRKWCMPASPQELSKSQSTPMKKVKKMRCMSDSSYFVFHVRCLRRYLSLFQLRCRFTRRVHRHVSLNACSRHKNETTFYALLFLHWR